ncbi:MAG: hypothetical protein KTR24_10670 [Saprospiraceae bacterium]|nr:hypothetical protein [Saprospiraceae bacterium]
MEKILLSGKPLSYYLEVPQRSGEIEAGQLEKLLQAYPYSEQLHTLRVIRHYLASGRMDESLLQQAATYAKDRTQLAAVLSRLDDHSSTMTEDTPMAGSERYADDQPPGESAAANLEPEVPVAHSFASERYLETRDGEPKVVKTKIIDDDASDPIAQRKKADASGKKKSKRKKKTRLAKALADLEQKQVTEKSHVDDFVLWLQRLDGMIEEKSMKPAHAAKRKKKKSTPKQKKKKSSELSTPISETLADLLAMQGRTDQAIEMYKALGLKYPQKSTFFAAKIRDLANKT